MDNLCQSSSSKAFQKIDIGGCLSQDPVGKLIQIGFEFAPSTWTPNVHTLARVANMKEIHSIPQLLIAKEFFILSKPFVCTHYTVQTLRRKCYWSSVEIT